MDIYVFIYIKNHICVECIVRVNRIIQGNDFQLLSIGKLKSQAGNM